MATSPDAPKRPNIPLSVAVERGDTEAVKAHLHYGVDVNEGWNSEANCNALSPAVANGDLKLVNLLLDNGAYMKESYVHMAAVGGHVDVLERLLDAGAVDPSKGLDELLWRVIGGASGHYARGSTNKELEVCRFLMGRGADISEVICRARYVEQVKFLQELGIDLNYRNKQGDTLWDAV
ncbi:MAG: ankyrin repeat domain-containing protein, partial [Lentisphaerae bacterium]|nr:ankyrin repeat domain-containing protein [Lentisphaerota bacterium]